MKRVTRLGFTLVELLVVISILAILAALTLAGVAQARRWSLESNCIFNLRQIGQAFTMYVDVYGSRPNFSYQLMAGGYLKDSRLLVCPADPTGNLAGIDVANGRRAQDPPDPIPVSYYYAGRYLSEVFWDRLMEQMGPAAGIVACQVHGTQVGDPTRGGITAYEGKVLRLQVDGAVVRRHILWKLDSTGLPPGARPSKIHDPWRFFSDKPLPLLR
jgi:prepilin-type N-terminal cleavage/methylation domain-containing protein